jgi:hypothetical protein
MTPHPATPFLQQEPVPPLARPVVPPSHPASEHGRCSSAQCAVPRHQTRAHSAQTQAPLQLGSLDRAAGGNHQGGGYRRPVRAAVMNAGARCHRRGARRATPLHSPADQATVATAAGPPHACPPRPQSRANSEAGATECACDGADARHQNTDARHQHTY